MIKKFFSSNTNKYLELFVIAIWFILPLVLVIEGTKLVMMIGSTGQIAQTINVPMWSVYTIIPIGGLLMCYRLIQQVIYVVHSFKS